MVCAGKCTSNARLDGKTALITGSNTGIGKETVKDLYKRGAKVIMACRNLEKANATAEEIKNECKDDKDVGKITVTELDLTSLKSVRNCAKNILETEDSLHILINNAGVMMCPESKTEDGFEMQFGTNHLGHFLFTLLLLPKIIASAPARIVNVSSRAHTSGKIDLDDLNWEKRSYSALYAYAQSKLANILFSRELANRLKEANINNVNVYSLHPGVIKTELGRHLNSTIFQGFSFFYSHVFGWMMKTPVQGAQTSIYCAVDEKCADETGLYYSDCAVKEEAPAAKDDEMAKKLWETSVKLVELDENYNPFVKS